MPSSKNLKVAIDSLEKLLRDDPNLCQVDRRVIRKAMKIVEKLQRGQPVRKDQVDWLVRVVAELACNAYLNRGP